MTSHFVPQPQPADFGTYEKHSSIEMEDIEINHLPKGSITPGLPHVEPPLKSALKTPGTSRPMLFSPTFQEEEDLEKYEAHTEKEQAKDLVS